MLADVASSLGTWPVLTLLVGTRLAALLLFTPLLQAIPVPPTVRVLLVIGLSAAVAFPLSAGDAQGPLGLGGLLVALACEAAVGAAMGVGILAAFAAVSVAARLLDVQVGFGIGQVFDPVSRRPVPVLSSLLSMLSVLLFFLLDGHHTLLRGVAASLAQWPPGSGWGPGAPAAHLLNGMAALFGSAFALAVPLVLCLLLVDLAFGAVARNLPQFNLLILGTPAKIVVGLIVLSTCIGLFGSGSVRVQRGALQDWTTLLERAGATRGAR
jgi:flagellar biosynthetic protein FliR